MRIAVIGDIHRHWDDQDAPLLDAEGLDLVLVTGDLGGASQRSARAVATGIGRLRTPCLAVPGNHDGASLGQLLGEVVQSPPLIRAFGLGHAGRASKLERAFAGVPVGGYSLHRFGDLDVICGRPHSMGGPSLSFAPLLASRWGIRSLEDSTRRLRELVERSSAPDLLILAHNGPSGLGAGRADIWGCDFRAEEGDHGDPDLAAAVEHAAGLGRPLRAVVAGHMHTRLRGGGERRWQLERGGVLYVNAARVPRHHRGRRHHVLLTLQDGRVEAVERWL